jgi:hypothetical protein
MLAICIAIAGMENRQVIDILDVAFLKVDSQIVFFSNVMQRIQRFCLSFSDWRNVVSSRIFAKSGE